MKHWIKGLFGIGDGVWCVVILAGFSEGIVHFAVIEACGYEAAIIIRFRGVITEIQGEAIVESVTNIF